MTEAPPRTVAVLGLGAMGAPIAANLLKAGFTVRAWNRTPRKIPELESAMVQGTPADAVAGADAVITMLSDDRAVEQVTLGPSGIVTGMAAGAIHIGMSTISPALAERLVDEHPRHGSHYISAPVFGRPEAARARALWIVPGGSAELLSRVSRIFEAIGQGTFPMPTAPQANLAKLAGNFLIAATMESLGEALVLGEKGGIPPETLLEMLVGTIFGSPVVKTYGGKIARGEFEPAGFALALGLKDVNLVIEAAARVGIRLPLAELARERLLRAIERGRAQYDWSGMATVIREDAGLDPRP